MSDLAAAVCPNCGAPLRELVNGACPFCRAVITTTGGGAPPVPDRPPAGTVWLHDCGANKIKVIKVVREHTGFGLKEAKDLTDAVVPGRPIAVAQGLSPEQAAAFATDLVHAGAQAASS